MTHEAIVEHLGPYRFGQVEVNTNLPADNLEGEMSIEELKEHGQYYRYEPTTAYVEWLKNKKLETEVTDAQDCEVKEITPRNWTAFDKHGEIDENVLLLNPVTTNDGKKEMQKWENELNATGSIERNLKRMKKTVSTRLKNEARKMRIDNVAYRDSLVEPLKLLEHTVPMLKVIDRNLVDPHNNEDMGPPESHQNSIMEVETSESLGGRGRRSRKRGTSSSTKV